MLACRLLIVEEKRKRSVRIEIKSRWNVGMSKVGFTCHDGYDKAFPMWSAAVDRSRRLTH